MYFYKTSVNRTLTGLFALLINLQFGTAAMAKLSVVTTTTDLSALVKEIGGTEVSVESICKGTQDPHYIEAKPSFMIKINRADLVLANGLELEIGWLPSILRGARNPKVMEGNPGFLEVGPLVDVLEKPAATVTRAEGDVHPSGNPHVTLDPIRLGSIAVKVAERMGDLDSTNKTTFVDRALSFQKRLNEKTKGWQERIEKTGIKKIVTHHKTLTYFFDRFRIVNPAILEPKPGIPPTSKHIIAVTKMVREQKIPLILIENFFDAAVARRIETDVPDVRILSVPVAVGGEEGIETSEQLYEKLIATLKTKRGKDEYVVAP